ncbi:MAG: hypothetical protein RIQ33_2489 [Bacteroidota bacterium]|jgi:hypothetical protein
MKKNYLIIVCLLIISNTIKAQSSFQRVVTDAGNIQLSLTNAGTIGDPSMASASANKPSMQYPKTSGKEHLFEAGLWIGAKMNGQTAVSTASVDASGGYSTGASGFEFTSNAGGTIQQKSSLSSNTYYSSSAISHQDFVLDFTDKNTIVPGTNTAISGHALPLNADVHLETYCWNYGYADYFVILNYTITNHSQSDWDSVYTGIWSDLIVRNINVTTASGTSFFNKGACGWLDTLKAVYAYDYNGDPGYTNSYGSFVFLGADWNNLFFHPDNSAAIIAAGYTAPQINLNFWRYKDVGSIPPYVTGYPSGDVTRYDRMKMGINPPHTNIFLYSPDNRTEVMSVGPFAKIKANESVNFSVGFVCAKQGGPSTPNCVDDYTNRTELVEHIKWVQRTYKGEDLNNNGILDAGEDLNGNNKLDRFLLPTPPNNPIVKIIPSDKEMDIYWDKNAEQTIDPISKKKDFEGYNLYRNIISADNSLTNGDNIKPIATWDLQGDSIGYNNGFSSIKMNTAKYFDGDTTAYWYHYHASGLLNGWKYKVIVTAYDKGDKSLNLEPLESSLISNTYNVWAGTSADNKDEAQIGVYPNPYTIDAAWDGSTARSHKLYFYNLPAQCLVTIYSLSGEMVANFSHEASTYNGSEIDWYKNLGGDEKQRIMPGGEHAFDILSNAKQALTQGLYLFSVKNTITGTERRGQFAVIR